MARRTLSRLASTQDITRVCLNLFGNDFYAAATRQKQGSDRRLFLT